MQISAIGILTKNKQNKVLKPQGGFTLIEILVVVFIISLMVGVVSLRIGGNDSRVALLEAKRFIHIVNEVQDLAVLSGKPYALAFDKGDNSYAFLHNPPKWVGIDDGELFKQRKFPEVLTIDINVEKIENSDDDIVNDNSTELSDLGSGEVSKDDGAESVDETQKGIDITPNSNQVLISPLSGVSPFKLTLSTDELQLQIGLNEEQRLEAKKL